tara:strand:- start:42 stop:248 length:207 start_codon:yes stop_codon:yes gene_type:complete
MQRRSCFFVFSFEEGKEEGELCLRPETAPLKISSFVKRRKKKLLQNFLSFFLSFVKEKRDFNFNDPQS